jgi:hypothetical protein
MQPIANDPPVTASDEYLVGLINPDRRWSTGGEISNRSTLTQ